MIKRFLTVLLLGAVIFSCCPAQADVINRLTGEVITKDGITYSGVPVWCFKIDDGRDWIFDKDSAGRSPWEYFTKKGIPISVTINGSSVESGAAATVTKAQLRELLVVNRDQPIGLPLVELMTHTYTNMNPNSDNKLFEVSHEQWETEFGSDWFKENFGVDIKSAALPGGGPQQLWRNRNRGRMSDLMRKAGILYANMNSNAGGSDSVSGYPHWTIDSPEIFAVRDDGFFIGPRGIRPGNITDPYDLPQSNSLDLGPYFMERRANQYSDRFGSMGSTAEWLIRLKSDDTNALTSTEAKAFWDNSVQYIFYTLLGHGLGSMFSLHAGGADELDNYTDVAAAHWFDGGGSADGAVKTSAADNDGTGAIDFEAVARLIRALWEEGFIVPVTFEEYGEWATSQYQPGLNLLDWNAELRVPQIAVEDTSGTHYFWVAGMGSASTTGDNWSTAAISGFGTGRLTELTTGTLGGGRWDSGWDDSVTPGTPAEVVDGDDYISRHAVAGLGDDATKFKGLRGWGFWTISFTNLPPATYEFSMLQNGKGDVLDITGYAYGSLVKKPLNWAGNQLSGAFVYEDSLFHFGNADTAGTALMMTIADVAEAGVWTPGLSWTWTIPREIPQMYKTGVTGDSVATFVSQPAFGSHTNVTNVSGSNLGRNIDMSGPYGGQLWQPIQQGFWAIKFRKQTNATESAWSWPTLVYKPHR